MASEILCVSCNTYQEACTKQLCRPCYRRDWYIKNKERHDAATKAYNRAHKARISEYSALWHQANRSRRNQQARQHYLNNRAYYHEKTNVRRGRIRQQLSALPLSVREEIRKIYAECPPGHHVDHIIPLNGENVCGLHVPWNLQYLPAKENLKKSNSF